MATSSNFTTSNQFILYRIVVTELSTDIASNTSSVNVKVDAWRTNSGYTTDDGGTCYANINGTDYSNSWAYGEKPITYNSHTVLLDQTVTIPHDSDGKKTIYVSAYIRHNRFSSNSQGFNVTLTDIPRQATLLSAPNFYDTDNPTITYSNPAGGVVTSLQACISFDNSTANISYRDISKTGSSYTFNLTQSERQTLYNSTPNSNTKTVYFIVKSVIAGVTYYSSLAKTLTIKDALPVIGSISYADNNATITAISHDNSKIVQDKSNVVFDFSYFVANKGATLSSISVNIDGVIVTDSLSGVTVLNHSLTFGTVNSAENVKAICTLTDSRGNYKTGEITLTMIPYANPSAVILLARKNNYYDTTYLKVNGSYSDINGYNSLTIQYQYKEQGGSYTSLVTIQDGTQYTLTLDNTKYYEFRIILTDDLNSVTTYLKTLQIGIPILYIDRLLRSVGFGCLPTEPNMLAVDRRLQLKNTLQEAVADLWTTATSESGRSAFLRFYNKDGDATALLSGHDGGGLWLYFASGAVEKGYFGGQQLRLNNSAGAVKARLWTSNGYGVFQLYDASGNEIILIAADTGKIIGKEIDTRDASGNVYTQNKFDNSGGQFIAKDSSGQDVAWLYAANGGNLYLTDSSGQSVITAYGYNGVVTCVSVTQTSSRKVKENIKPLTSAEALKVLELIAVTFDFKDKQKGTNKRGFIAEDVAEIIPELVTPETDKEPATLDYIGLIPYLQTVIKSQERKISELEKRLTDLEKLIKEK